VARRRYRGSLATSTIRAGSEGQAAVLTAEDHKTVDVFDLEGKHLNSITGFGQPHAALFLPESNKLIVADGDDDFGRVELVSGEDYKILSTIKLPMRG